MADNYLSGKDGFVTLDGGTYSFGKWDAKIKTGAPKVTNFTSNGFRDNVEGITEADISLTGPYNAGNMPLKSGKVYTFNLGWGAGLLISIPARVTGINPTNDADGNPAIAVTAESKGEFTASIDGGT